MATFDAKIITPPDPIAASIVVMPAVITNAPTAASPRVSVEQREGIVRRSRRG